MNISEGVKRKIAKEFWKKKIGSCATSDLLSFSQTVEIEDKQNDLFAVIPNDLVKKINSLCNDSDFLEHTFYLSILHILLHRYNKTEQIITGGYLMGHEDISTIQEQIVLYTSKINLTNNFKEIFTDLKKEVSEVSEQFGISYDSYKKLFPEIVNDLFKIGFAITENNNVFESSDFDLFVRIDKKQETRLIFELHKEEYSSILLKNLAENYVYLLEEVINNIYIPIEKLNYISPQEILEIESFCSGVSVERFETIYSLFEKQVIQSCNKRAVSFNGDHWTYNDLNNYSNRLARYLVEEYQVVPNKLVGVMISKSNWTIATFLAILKAGGAYVPIDSQYPTKRINYIIENSGIDLLITESDLFFNLDFYKGSFLVLDIQFDLLPVNDSNLSGYSTPDDLAYMIYTSGSTGQPKGVMIQHKSICNTLLWRKTFYELDSDVINLQFPSYSFDSSVEDIFSILISGGTIVIPKEELKTIPHYIKDLIIEHQISNFLVTPSFYRFLLEEIPETLEQLKVVTVAGEAIQSGVVDKHFKLLPAVGLINEYGPTENAVCSTATYLRPFEKVHIGRPIDNVVVHILDDQLRSVPIGVKGELCVSGIGLAVGYFKEEELTAQKFVTIDINGKSRLLYRTGDMACWQSNGTIEYFGRNDRQVKIRGYRIEIGEVEILISNLPNVEQGVVIDLNKGEDGTELAAFVVTNKKSDKDSIMTDVREQLPHFMVPSIVIIVDKIPLTVHGKVDYEKLLILTEEQLHTDDDAKYVAPETYLEQKLAEIWEETLAKKNIGLLDDFFVLGGHSLKAIQIISRIQKQFNLKVEIKTLFSNPTIKALSQVLEEETNSFQFSPIEVYSSENNYYELSNAQKRLWFLCQFESGSSAYNSTSAFEIDGVLKIDFLAEAFNQLIKRHESLRTNFIIIDEEPKQFIHDPQFVDFELQTIDLKNDEFAEETSEKIARGEATTPFDLEKGSLLRATIINLSDQKNILLLSSHHIISDGWSITVMFNDIIKVYNKLYHDNGVELPKPKIQYKDYTLWVKQLLNSPEFEEHRIFWVNKFQGDIPVLELLTDYPRPEVKSYNGRFQSYQLNSEHIRIINDLALKFDTSKFVILQSIIKVLLYKYTGQTDIIIGSLMAGRDHIDLEDQVGFYVNTIPLRTKFNENDTYNDLVLNIKDNTLNVFKHNQYPFDVLIDKLDVKRSLNRTPLFDVLLVLQNLEFNTTEQLAEVSIKPFDFEFNRSKFDLSFYFTEKDIDAIDLKIEYDTDLFHCERIDNIFEHLKALIESISKNDSEKLKLLSCVTDNERDVQLNKFNNAQIPFNKDITIHQLFEQQLQLNKNKTALVYGDTNFSYLALEEKANKLANCLVNNGVLVGDSIALMLQRSEEVVVAMLAILKVGAAYVPIDPLFPTDRIEYMIRDTSSKIIISESKFIDLCDKLQWDIDILKSYICVNALEVSPIENYERETRELWDYVANSSDNLVQASGWINSYSGAVFQNAEIKEMVDNISFKVEPFLNQNAVVLEIGCGTGMIISELAPKVKKYIGTDISNETLKICKDNVANKGISNVLLQNLSALEIGLLKDTKFDLIIVNSVIQYFPSHQYLRDFLSTASELLSDNGVIFLGDIRDKNLQEDYYQSLLKNDKTKSLDLNKMRDTESELFLSDKFFEDFFGRIGYQSLIKSSEKIGSIKNELSMFRFDMTIELDKKNKSTSGFTPDKYQIWKSGILEYSDKFSLQTVKGNNLAYIIYTSGSSGKPKGVQISHTAVVNFLLSMTRLLEFTSRDSLLAITTFTFDISILELFMPLTTGGLVYIAPSEAIQDGLKFQELLQQTSPSFLQGTPSFWKMLIDSGWNGDLSMNLLTGGENLEQELGKQMLDLGANVYNLYGPTETTIWSTLQPIKEVNDLYSIGKPIDNTSVYILDPQGAILPAGIQGEIHIGGLGLAHGYINNLELTENKFLRFPKANNELLYKTGDMGRWFIDGRLEYRGRVDNQIKIRGYRIEPGEVESAILSFGTIKDTVVCSQLDHTNSKILVTYLISENEIDVALLRKHLAKLVPDYMIPTYFYVIETIPLTSNGKTDYKQLGLLGNKYVNKQTKDFMAPTNEIEKELSLIWENIIGVENPSVKDNFFEIGGHSITATKLVSRIYEQLKVKIEIKDVFLYPTIYKLANYVQHLEKKFNIDIPIVQKSESYSISNAQKRLWIFSQLNKKSTAYNMSGVYSVRGKLSISALRESLGYLMERNEILRTSFRMHKGEPRQFVHEYDYENIPFKFLDKSVHQNDSEALKQLIDDENSILFEMNKLPLFKASCIRTGEEEYIFVFVIHHIIADAWSVQIIINEFFQVYKTIIADKLPDVTPLRIQYKDYCEWQLKTLQLDKMRNSGKFWGNQFSTFPPPLNLPVDFDRNNSKSYNGKILTRKINDEFLENIKAFNRDNKTTIFTILLTSVKILLFKYTGNCDITIGVPVAGRDHLDLEKQIGFYVNTLPIRTTFEASDNFLQVFNKVKNKWIESAEHQNYPFDSIIDDLTENVKNFNTPLFDVLVELLQEEENQFEQFNKIGLEIHPIELENTTSKFDLSFKFRFNGSLDLNIEYNTDIFLEETIERIYGHWLSIIYALTQGEDNEIGKWNLVDLTHDRKN